MFNSQPYSVNTSRTVFNMTPVKDPFRKNTQFSIERDHATNIYSALIGKNATSQCANTLSLTDINGIANQIPEFTKPVIPPPSLLNDDLNTKFFVTSITILGLYMFYSMSTRY